MNARVDEFGNPIPEPDGIAKLRKEFKEQGKRLKALEAENATLKTQSRSGSVADALASNGLDPRVAKFYPGDRATTVDAVAEWVDENRELFPKPVAQQPDPHATTLSEDQQKGYEIMRLLGEAESATALDFKSRMDQCETEEELLAFFDEFGASHPFG